MGEQRQMEKVCHKITRADENDDGSLSKMASNRMTNIAKCFRLDNNE
jgi:hypothetical protein